MMFDLLSSLALVICHINLVQYFHHHFANIFLFSKFACNNSFMACTVEPIYICKLLKRIFFAHLSLSLFGSIIHHKYLSNSFLLLIFLPHTLTSLFIETINFPMSIMHQAWNIAEVRSLIFTKVNSLRDLVQLAATCKAFTKPATLELLEKQTSIVHLKRLIPLNGPALASVCVFNLFFLLGLLINTTRIGLPSIKLLVL